MMKEDFTFFFSRGSPFSNWTASPFTFAGNRWNCAEQFMMASKAFLFADMKTYEKVLASKDPREQKALGRQVKEFDQRIWEQHCLKIMVPALVAKFEQNEAFKEALKATIGTTLVEASPYDTVWGIGLSADDPRAWEKETWLGRNLLGVALMRARKEIFGE
jgi:ribA/ribD-fused uncharacterized protein